MIRFAHGLLLCASILAVSWLGMMALHESGHALAAWTSGGTVTKVVLHPSTISRTNVSPNPHPLVVVWAGPIGCVMLPLAIWAAAIIMKWPYSYLARFFAGFCLLANGAYIGIGSFDGVGDAGDMLRLGSPIGLLWLFGIATAPLGLFLWHGVGRHFGLGELRGQVNTKAAWGSFAFAIMLIAFLRLGGKMNPPMEQGNSMGGRGGETIVIC